MCACVAFDDRLSKVLGGTAEIPAFIILDSLLIGFFPSSINGRCGDKLEKYQGYRRCIERAVDFQDKVSIWWGKLELFYSNSYDLDKAVVSRILYLV